MKTNIDIARQVICSYFESLASRELLGGEGFQELCAIKFDKSNKVLLEHIKALNNIFGNAIKEIEEGGNK
ncbi:MAG: hypothetical protein IKN65_00230 [Clostridia bacterium]|nr:hypothetical protein [Bacilli bacterium]MBR3672710.1 hypothetical protein [Clostridia bacterium]MBR4671584.1 hypothetical protein [Bacilli bacterium]